MTHPNCEHGKPASYCERCDDRRLQTTPWHRADRTPGPHLADRDEKILRETLRDLPDRITVAAALIAGEKLAAADDGTRPVPGSRPPLNLAVVDLTRRGKIHDDPIAHMTTRSAGILAMLQSWTRLAHGEMLDTDTDTTDPTMHPTVGTECAWLLRHIVWILEQQWVTELAVDLGIAERDVKAVLRERAPYAPRCDRCTYRLEAMDGGSWYRCTGCHRVIDHWAELKRLAEIQPPMTLAELSAAVDVPVKTLHDWHKRGLLTPVTDAKRGRVFDPYEARQVKATLRHGPNRRVG